MSKVEIYRIDSKLNNGFRYKVYVFYGKERLGRGWTFTLWGAKRKAKKIIEEAKQEDVLVKEYEL